MTDENISGESFTIGGSEFVQPLLHPDLRKSEPCLGFDLAIQAAQEFVKKSEGIESDPHLSGTGRKAKIEPFESELWGSLCSSEAITESFRQHIDKTEAELLAVPPTASATEATLDAEARGFWRGLPQHERAKLLHRFGNDEAFSRQYAHLMRAILRSPIPLPSLDDDALRGLWNRACRLNDPAKAAKVEQGRIALSWTERGLEQVKAIAKTRLTRWSRERMADYFVGEPARERHAARFGVGGDALVAARARAANKARQAAR